MSAIKRQAEKDMEIIANLFSEEYFSNKGGRTKTVLETAERTGIYSRRKKPNSAISYVKSLLTQLVNQGVLEVDFNEVHNHQEYSLTGTEISIRKSLKSAQN